MALPEEELQKQLRNSQHTGSPALAGQPPSITGQPDPAISTPSTSSTAPLPGGNATGASAPLSQTGADESRDGAVDPSRADAFLKDRGTPEQFLGEQMYTMGSNQVMAAAQESHNRVSLETGEFSQSPQEAAEAGERFNKAIGLDNGETQRSTRASMANMFGDMTKKEVDNEIITPSEKKKKDEEFTKFLGGMSRQEFGMFLFDWGARMMANTNEGWAGAGAATGGALAGHMGRRQMAEDREIEAGERERQAGLDERGMVAEEQRALAGLGEGEQINTKDGLGVLRRDEDGNYSVEIMRDEKGNPIKQEFAGDRPYRGEKPWIVDQLVSSGMTRDQAMDIATGARNPAERSQLLQDQLAELMDDRTAKDANGKYYREYTVTDKQKWIVEQMELVDRAVEEYNRGRELDRALREY